MLVHKPPPEGTAPREAIVINRGGTVTVGRNPSAVCKNIFSSLDPKTISKRHAVLESDEDGRCTISPLSLNTFINGKQVGRAPKLVALFALESSCVLGNGRRVGNCAGAIRLRYNVSPQPPPWPKAWLDDRRCRGAAGLAAHSPVHWTKQQSCGTIVCTSSDRTRPSGSALNQRAS